RGVPAGLGEQRVPVGADRGAGRKVELHRPRRDRGAGVVLDGVLRLVARPPVGGLGERRRHGGGTGGDGDEEGEDERAERGEQEAGKGCSSQGRSRGGGGG